MLETPVSAPPSVPTPETATALAPAIAVAGLTVRHLGRRRRCLEDVSLEVAPGERLLVVGPSGAGKSTLALCLVGLVPHAIDVHWEAGTVRVGGTPTADAAPGDLTRRAGYLFQDPDAQVVLGEVDDDIAFGLENRGVPRAEMPARIREARAATGLDGPRVPRDVRHLSGGTKQRLALAGLVVARPDVLVLDEPVANVDPEGAAAIWATVGRLVAGRARSLVVIEHAADDVLDLVDRVVVLDESGRVACTGTPDEVFVGHRDRVRGLGVRLPAWAVVAAIAGSARLPRSADAAARMLAAATGRRRTVGRTEMPAVTGAMAPDGPRMPAARATGQACLSLRGVGFRYPGAAGDAIAGIDLDLHAGELVAVVGGNGAGKSTLGLVLAGAHLPTAGTVALEGRPLGAVPVGERRRRLRYVFQYPEHQFVGQTVRADLEAAVKVESLAPAAAAARVAEALRSADLDHLAEANPFTLSHGQKRRLSVATALVTDPDVVVLDEPTFGQDDRHAARLMRGIAARVAAGGAAVVVTHDLDLVAEHATRVVAMADGRVAFDGHPADLLADDAILAACALRRPPAAEVVARAVALGLDVPDVACRRHLERILDSTGESMAVSPDPSTPVPTREGGVRPTPPTPTREGGVRPVRGGPGPNAPAGPPAVAPSWLARRNPTVKFATVIGLGLALTFVTDPVTPALWWTVVLVVAASAGVSPRRLLPALVPVAAFAVGLVLTNAFLAARPPGEVILWEARPFRLTWHGIWIGIALALRGLATATVGLTFIMTTDPTELVISLVRHGRLPYRWGYAVLAGYRFLPGLAEELAQVRLARRVRGEDVADGRLARLAAPVRELRILLVVAILHAARLAVAMDARGFADVRARTYFREVGIGMADAALVAGAVGALGAVVTATWSMGVLRGWSFLG